MNAVARLAVLLAAVALGAAAPPAKQDAKAAKTPQKPKKPRVLVTISKETTRITGPLRPDGYPDYVAALNQFASKGVTPENNAAVLLWRAFGPAEIGKEARERFFKLLGIPPLPEKGDYFISFDAFVKQSTGTGQPAAASQDEERLEKAYDEQGRAMEAPWSKKDCPAIAAWLEANRKPLVLIFEATRRPRRYDPLVTTGNSATSMLIGVLLPEIQQHRDAARALVARAMLRLGEGKTDAAWADLLACHRLARLSGQGATLIDGLVGIAIDGMACHADQALLQHTRLTAAQALRMQADLRRLPSVCKMGDKIDVAERFMFLDSVTMLAREGIDKIRTLDGGEDEPGAVAKSLMNLAARLVIDWDRILRMGNSWYDRMVEASRKPTRAEREQAVARIDDDLHTLAAEAKDPKSLALAMLGSPRQAASERLGHILVALFLPAVSATTNAEDRGTMQLQVTRLGFALAAYRADHGTYPAKLSELAPKYVPKVLKDIFSGGPLHYASRADGYVLYSVGSNGKDDGGRGYRERETDKDWNGADWDDLIIRMPAEEKPKKPDQKQP